MSIHKNEPTPIKSVEFELRVKRVKTQQYFYAASDFEYRNRIRDEQQTKEEEVIEELNFKSSDPAEVIRKVIDYMRKPED